jgi:hypothetical protein
MDVVKQVMDVVKQVMDVVKQAVYRNDFHVDL